jgi:hypothetical protein
VVSDTGKRLVSASDHNSAAWDVALQYADYKSTLNDGSPSLPKFDTPGEQFEDYYPQVIPSGYSIPDMKHYGIAPKESEAQFMVIGHDPNKNLKYGIALLSVEGGGLVVDGMQIRNVVFRNVHVVYRGGIVVMSNVYFVGCTFEMQRNNNSLLFADSVLGSDPATSFSVDQPLG